MYTLSKEYSLLLSFLRSGHEPVAYVDYSYREDMIPSRDVCRIRRYGAYSIQFSARGISYGSVDTWDEDRGITEEGVFIKECERMNLEWILP